MLRTDDQRGGVSTTSPRQHPNPMDAPWPIPSTADAVSRENEIPAFQVGLAVRSADGHAASAEHRSARLLSSCQGAVGTATHAPLRQTSTPTAGIREQDAHGLPERASLVIHRAMRATAAH